MSLSRIRAEPFSQVVHGFTAAEKPDRDDLRPALGGVGDGSGTRAGDDQAPRGTLRPHPLGDCRLRQVIEHDQPGLAGFPRPADKARSARLSLPRLALRPRRPPRPARIRTGRLPGRWQRSRPANRQSRIATVSLRSSLRSGVLPHTPRQSGWPSKGTDRDASATAEPGTRVRAASAALSGRAVYPPASGGTSPTVNRRVCPDAASTRASPPAIPSALRSGLLPGPLRRESRPMLRYSPPPAYARAYPHVSATSGILNLAGCSVQPGRRAHLPAGPQRTVSHPGPEWSSRRAG